MDWRTAAVDGLALLESEDFDVVVTDLNLGGMSGLELCERVVTNRADIPVVVITAFGSLETAVAAIRAGAYDFITKPFAVEMLALTLGRAVRHRALREEVKRLRRVVAHSRTFGDLLGTSPAMRAVTQLLERVARRTRPCSSPARPEPARSWPHARSTSAVDGRTARSWR